MYKPLPESLTIKASGIHDLGLFAEQDIKQATNLGVTHIKLDDNIIRTPLGGFIYHADEPNCVRNQISIKPGLDKWNLMDIEDIEEGCELTLKYKLYVPEKT